MSIKHLFLLNNKKLLIIGAIYLVKSTIQTSLIDVVHFSFYLALLTCCVSALLLHFTLSLSFLHFFDLIFLQLQLCSAYNYYLKT